MNRNEFMKRIFRDLFILLVFCGGFFLLIQAVNLFGSDNLPQAPSEHSYNRQQADSFMTRKQYGRAAEFYKQMTIDDPDNGQAWYALANCSLQRRRELRRYAYQNSPNESTNPRVAGARKRAAEYADRAIEPLKKSIDFARYRNLARILLAEIYASKGEDDTAIKFIRDAMDDGYFTKAGLGMNYDFQTLRGSDEFDSLIGRENLNRRRYRQGNSDGSDVDANVGN